MTTRVLPADVYDALELSALIHGGIGAGRFYSDTDVPYCVVGHAGWLDDSVVLAVLNSARIYTTTNDRAVRRAGGGPHHRITFARWCKALNVVRGD